MTHVNIHAIGNRELGVSVRQLPGNVPVIEFIYGTDTVSIFLHDGKAEKALADIDTAIRAFVGSQE